MMNLPDSIRFTKNIDKLQLEMPTVRYDDDTDGECLLTDMEIWRRLSVICVKDGCVMLSVMAYGYENCIVNAS